MKILKIIFYIVGVFLLLIILFIFLLIFSERNQLERGKMTSAKMQLKNFETAILQYNKGTPPTTEEGLEALVKDGLIKRIPKDPWGNDFQYRSPGIEGREYEI